MNHIIGIMAMAFGFIGMAIGNYAGAYLCFGYAFALWCVLAVYELYEHIKKRKMQEVKYEFYEVKTYEDRN